MSNEKTYFELPVIALRGLVGFPGVQLNVDLARPLSLKAFSDAATNHDSKIILLTQKEFADELPTPDDLYHIGVVATIKHVSKNPQSHLSVVFEGHSRFIAENIYMTDAGILMAKGFCKEDDPTVEMTPSIVAWMTQCRNFIKKLPEIHPSFTDEMNMAAYAITDPYYFCDFVASSALIDYKNKQDVLESSNPLERLKKLLTALNEEAMLLETEHRIQMEVREKIDESQKQYFLREQMKAIQSELGEDEDDEIREYEERIEELAVSENIKEKLFKELTKLAKAPYGSAEITVLRTYLDTVLEFPFGKHSTELPTVQEARKILDEDHGGLEKVKERILEFVAVKQFSPDVKNQIICLIGPPGTGKTSVAASIARALKRQYARVSLGGMHDEAEIRGHRKTYVGAMPGRIITAISDAKVDNPVIVLDEIDKMSSNFKGDPTSALLEVLDPEQNKFFRDNFMEIAVDLSDCMFIATANSYEGIPLPLLDRMEVIELSTYTDTEKLSIVKNHIVPKQLIRHGMTKASFRISDAGILALIKGYTKEAGVRNLEREIASLIRKAAKKIAEDGVKSVRITERNLSSYLGKVKYLPEFPESENPVGVVNGLAYTQTGGDLLKVEVAVMEGTGKIELTGSLGEVMKESARIALSFVRTIATKYNIDPEFYKKTDIHIHFPEGAIPKDGPSAGVTMVCAMVSALSKIPASRTIAMTGEVTLRGKVLPIGGLREKTLAAYRSGIKTVIIPEENMRNLDEVDETARENLTFIPVKSAEDALSHVLCQ